MVRRNKRENRDTIAEIKGRLGVSEVLGLLGLPTGKPGTLVPCSFPEHGGDDKVGSLSISNDDKLAHCFGCHRGADVITLWREHTGRSFYEALAELAERAGVEYELDEEEKKSIAERAKKRDALSAAVDVAEATLWSAKGAPARRYLESVGVSDELAKRLRLGYLPSGRTLENELVRPKGAKFTLEDLDRAGLLTKPSRAGERFDALASSVVYPSIENGSVVYLKGRGVTLEGEPETDPRRKHRALDRTRVEQPALYWPSGRTAPIGSSVVTVEGEKDAGVVFEALRELDRFEVVGLCGASRVGAAAATLSKYRRVISLTDADRGGQQARDELGRLLGPASLVASLPYGDGEKDPAERLVALGKAEGSSSAGRALFAGEVLAAVRAPRRFLDVRLEEILEENAADPTITIAELVRSQLAPTLARFPDLDRSEALNMIQRKTKLAKSALGSAVKEEKTRLDEKRAKARDEERQSAARQDVEDLLEALGERFDGLFFRRNGSGFVALWSRVRSETIEVELDRYSRAASLLAPDLGDVESWVLDAVPGLERRFVAQRLIAALQEWARRLPPREGLRVLSDGVHSIEKGGALIIDGRRMFRFRPDGYGSGAWETIEHPVAEGKYLLRPNVDAERWLPKEWNLETLSAPLKYTPREVADHLHAILRLAWTFRENVDARIHALLPFVLVVASAWTWKPLVHLRAPRRSGKSWLLAWYCNVEKLPLPGWVPNSIHATDVSAAGVTGRLADAALAFGMDEFEGSENDLRRTREVLRLFRSSRMGGAGKLRGTKDQGYTNQRIDAPCIAASIEPISDSDADNSRWFVSELEHDPKRQKRPSDLFWTYVEENDLDVAEMRRTLLVGLLPHLEELLDFERDLSRDKLPGAERVDSRFLENVIPLLAVAKLLGYDPNVLVGQIIAGHVADYEEVEEDTVSLRLARALLFSPFRKEAAGGPTQITTLSAELDNNKAPGYALRIPEAGIWTEFADTEGREPILVVNWTTAKRAILAGTEFATSSERRLVQISREIPGRRTHGRTRAGGIRVHATKFLVEELVGRLVLRVFKGGDADKSLPGEGADDFGEDVEPKQTDLEV